MTTPAKMALDEIDHVDIMWRTTKYKTVLKQETIETIRAALKLMDEVQSGRLEKPLTSYWTTERDSAVSWNDCLDHLKQITGE